eukprot:COSAG06_NODE_6293_length_2994_cov_11.169257_4_plen_100_part_01
MVKKGQLEASRSNARFKDLYSRHGGETGCVQYGLRGRSARGEGGSQAARRAQAMYLYSQGAAARSRHRQPASCRSEHARVHARGAHRARRGGAPLRLRRR